MPYASTIKVSTTKVQFSEDLDQSVLALAALADLQIPRSPGLATMLEALDHHRMVIYSFK